MKILEMRASPNPRRVRVFLAEKGISVAFEELDFMKGALKTPEFGKINAFQRVPVLVLDDGTALSESMAICRYFEDLNPLPALFGTGAKRNWRCRRSRSGRRSTSRRRWRSCKFLIANWLDGGSLPGTPIRLPTSQRWSPSILCGLPGSPGRKAQKTSIAGTPRSRHGRAPRLEAVV